MADKEREWASLVNMPYQQAQALLQRQFEEIGTQDEDERRSRLRGMVEVEYSLPEEALRRVATARLRAWASMDPDTARRVAASYEAVMDSVPGPIAMRRVGVDQTEARSLTVDEQARLQRAVPALFPGMDMERAAEEVHEEMEGLAVTQEREAVAAGHLEARPEKKPWWAFWRG